MFNSKKSNKSKRITQAVVEVEVAVAVEVENLVWCGVVRVVR